MKTLNTSLAAILLVAAMNCGSAMAQTNPDSTATAAEPVTTTEVTATTVTNTEPVTETMPEERHDNDWSKFGLLGLLGLAGLAGLRKKEPVVYHETIKTQGVYDPNKKTM